MKTAPLFADMAKGPEGGEAVWRMAADGVRLRLAIWPGSTATASGGTVFLFSGRTEYIEKYGRLVGHLAKAGLTSLVIDWRGQGLSDRLVNDPLVGHVDHFDDYQADVAAAVLLAEERDLPKPWFLFSHSMGGGIALRALDHGFPVQATVFSAPMWGVELSLLMRPIAWALCWSSLFLGLDTKRAPTTTKPPYVLAEAFETNKLTTDPHTYETLREHMRAQPGLGVGGPSLRWVYMALRECFVMQRRPSPENPCLTILGSDEEIVSPKSIHQRMARWRNGVLDIIPSGRHEVLMEAPVLSDRICEQITDFFATHRTIWHGIQAGSADQAVQSKDPSGRPRSKTA